MKVIFNNIEFIRATIDRQLIFSDKRLEQAFKLFDKDNDGMISAKEIRNVLGRDCDYSADAWKNIINEVDINGDGEVSLEEFKKIMMNSVNPLNIS